MFVHVIGCLLHQMDQ